MASTQSSPLPLTQRPPLQVLVGITLILYVADQITKWLVERKIPFPTDPGHEVIPGFFWINHLHNTGVAFGMFNGKAGANIAFGIISLLAITGIIFLGRRGAFPGPVSRIAAAMLISGILGNLTDRLTRGYVVDFLRVDLKFMTWPSFNIADAAICVAAVLMILSSFLPEGKEAAKRDAERKKAKAS